MSRVLEIITRTLSTHLAHQAGFKKKEVYTGAVTLIQRFGSALNLNIHFDVHGRMNVAGAWMRRSDHMLFLDGVYVQDGTRSFVFHCNKAPTVEQLTELLHTTSQRVDCFLERRGLLERDEDNSYLTLDGLDEDPMQDIHSYSVTYRVALGPQRGRKVFTLQTIPPKPDLPSGSDCVANLAGFIRYIHVPHPYGAAKKQPCKSAVLPICQSPCWRCSQSPSMRQSRKGSSGLKAVAACIFQVD